MAQRKQEQFKRENEGYPMKWYSVAAVICVSIYMGSGLEIYMEEPLDMHSNR